MKTKLFSEQKYTKILKEVGRSSYKIWEPTEPIVSELVPNFKKYQFMGVCMGTSSTLSLDITYQGYKIPKGSEIIVQRVFRECQHGGTPHLNADDKVFFPIKNGNIMQLSRNDAPDHYVKITTLGGLGGIAAAYHLPHEKAGPINQYSENGALVPIKIDCPEHTWAKLENIRKQRW